MLQVKTNDKYPTYWTVPMDLTGADVRLLARRPGHPVIVLDSVVVDAQNGLVEHTLDGSLLVGTYQVELEVTRGDLVITAPTDSYANLQVISDLG